MTADLGSINRTVEEVNVLDLPVKRKEITHAPFQRRQRPINVHTS